MAMTICKPAKVMSRRRSILRSGRSSWHRHRSVRKGWTFILIAMLWCIGICHQIRSIWNNVKGEFTDTRAMLCERTSLVHIRLPHLTPVVGIHGNRCSSKQLPSEPQATMISIHSGYRATMSQVSVTGNPSQRSSGMFPYLRTVGK